jgi:tetratricopeptide (TPR) repeat protein
MIRAGRLGLAVITIACATATAAHAQRRPADRAAHDRLMSELGQLRQAGTFEAAGRYEEAEEIVADVLAANPTSLSGILTMERLLAAQGRTDAILPAIERLLEADPKSVIGYQTLLRVSSSLDDVSRLESAVAQWIRATPNLETPYREAALVWRNRGESGRAVELLEQGRRRIEREDALALELGDVFAGMNDMQRAAEEWSRAIGGSGRGLMLVQRRLQMMPDGGARIILPLVERLSAAPSTFARQRAAALLAIEAGLGPAAMRSMAQLAASAPQEEREQLLVELGRRADGADLPEVALVAYHELLGISADASASLAIRTRIAELALLVGDTSLAANTYRELEGAAAAGSPQRRQAIALRIQLTARDGDPQQAIAEYESFRAEYVNAPELDATSAMLGERLLDDGDLERADRVLSGVAGPRTAQLRGRLYLRRGDIDAARNELLSAAPLLRGREATTTIALATLLTRVSARGGELVAGVMSAHDPERAEQVRAAAAAARKLPAAERAAVLDFLADAADAAGIHEDAAAIRREIVESLPHTLEAPAALLTLARRAVGDPETKEEARVLLEKLIVEYPRSALAPQARTELQRLETH